MKFFAPIAIVMAVAASPATAQPAPASANLATVETADERFAVAYELVDIIYPQESRLALFRNASVQMMAQMRQSMPQSENPAIRAIVDRHLDGLPAKFDPILARHIPNIMSGITKAYAREFSLRELQDLRTFAQTPSGKHFLQRQSAILGDPDFAEANKRYMAEVAGHLPKFSEDLKAEITEYFRRHPGSAK